MTGRRLEADGDLRELLESIEVIAVVGLSPKPHRPSHSVSAYLQRAGYRVIPIRPGVEEVLGERAYSSLGEVPSSIRIDLVNVFRRPAALPALVPEVAAIRPRALWFQLGVVHPEAEADALARGLDLVVDRCILVEHGRLLAARS